jgi:hypothetical protein
VQPKGFTLSFNLKTARGFGLTIRIPLLRADEAIP